MCKAGSLRSNRRQDPSFHLTWEVRSPTWLPCSSMYLHGISPSLGCWDLGPKCTGRSGFVLCSEQLHFLGLALFLLFPRDPGSCPVIPILKAYISQTIPPCATLEPHSHLLKPGQDFPHSWLEPIHNCGPILGAPLLFYLPFFGPWSLCSYHASTVSCRGREQEFEMDAVTSVSASQIYRKTCLYVRSCM